MEPLTIFATWLTLFTISFGFIPIDLLMDWRKRGSSEGFSAVGFVMNLVVTSCWLKYGYMTNDQPNINISTVNIGLFTLYLSVFAYYQNSRKNIAGQVLVALATIQCVTMYINALDEKEAPDTMGTIASLAQILSLAGGIYEIKRVVSFGHTEYVPATFQFATFFLIIQWLLFGYLTDNIFSVAANFAGLIINVTTISLFFIYPPLTQRYEHSNHNCTDGQNWCYVDDISTSEQR